MFDREDRERRVIEESGPGSRDPRAARSNHEQLYLTATIQVYLPGDRRRVREPLCERNQPRSCSVAHWLAPVAGNAIHLLPAPGEVPGRPAARSVERSRAATERGANSRSAQPGAKGQDRGVSSASASTAQIGIGSVNTEDRCTGCFYEQGDAEDAKHGPQSEFDNRVHQENIALVRMVCICLTAFGFALWAIFGHVGGLK